MSTDREPLNAPPFSVEEITAAVRLNYDEPLASEQLALWSRAFAAAAEDPDPQSVWFFPVDLMAAMVVARPETATRVAQLRRHGDTDFEAEVERAWQAALASARARVGQVP